MLSDTYERIDPKTIIVKRDARHRREVEVEDLLLSIPQKGIINPIVITPELVLIAGERRLTAALRLAMPTVPIRYSTTLDPIELELLELEENVKRKDLSWQETISAVRRLHDLHLATNPKWTQLDTAKAVGLDAGNVSRYLDVSRNMDKAIISGASGVKSAINILSRAQERKIADAIGSLTDLGTKLFDKPPEPGDVPTPTILTPVPESILHGSFLEWAPKYSGQPFNFIHCDFPFGVNVFAGKQSNTKREPGEYSDKPDVYWELIDCFCENLNRFMSASAHVMFWFSFDYYTATLERFRKKAPSLAFQNFPLFWTKSDNIGILPDPKRGPRRIMEAAFIASREDRFVVRSVSNAYSAPTDKAWHPSTKPEPMLRYFFQMFVDENTRLLDPTCGSGSALRAAESLGAAHVFGIEQDKEHFDGAQIALKKFRAFRRLTT